MTPEATGAQADYEAPTVMVLGTIAELTQLGSGVAGEALNDGSQV